MQHHPVLTLILATSLSVAGCGGSSGGASQPTTPTPAPLPPPAPAISTQPAFSNLPALAQPVAMVQAPADDSSWYVVERAGRVLRFANDAAAGSLDTFIDISGDVDSGPGEAGLLAIAFHPDFQVNRTVFLSFTRPGLISYVSRFTSLDGGQTLDPATEEVILSVLQDANNHNGGHLAFGPDGFLYIGMGDGGGGNDPMNRAQDTTNLLGALLRIDIDNGSPFAVPATNPFAGNMPCSQGFGSADCPELFAWGLRNPWRWSFDRDSGDLWLGDVGQGDREEVNRVQNGANYGWRIREGASCNANINSVCDATGLVDPVVEYDHSQGVSITGGYVYRGSGIANLNGTYLFGDFGSGRIWGTTRDGQGVFQTRELLDTSLSIASFAEGNDGELYVLDYGPGRIYQLVEQP